MTSRPVVRGVDLDSQTRCLHYRSSTDIVAIRMSCCGEYYACKDCHAALAGHDLKPWPAGSDDIAAAMCGACGAELTVREYLTCGDSCTRCGALFNSRCALHHHLYFERPVEGSDAVERVLLRYFMNETTLEVAQQALLDEWRDLAKPGSHGPAMLALSKWTIRAAARSAGRDLDDETLYLLLEPISALYRPG